MIETASGWNATSSFNSGFRVFDTVAKKAQEEVSKSIRKVTADILRTAKKNAPVQSGNLRRSGRLSVVPGIGKNFVSIIISFGGKGTGVDYAHIVEMGSSKQPAQFYLLRAVRAHQKQLIPMGLKAFESVWDGEVRISNLSKLT